MEFTTIIYTCTNNICWKPYFLSFDTFLKTKSKTTDIQVIFVSIIVHLRRQGFSVHFAPQSGPKTLDYI